METFKHSIKAYRGESFTIDKTIRNNDGSPYIISNELQNPYFLLSVSNTKYSQENRFVRNYWLSLEDFPRFTLTTPINSEDVENWSSDATINDLLINVDGELCTMDASFAVINDDGTYLYWDTETSSWKNYECRLVKTFTSDDTKDWSAQTYLYSIQLVSGIKQRSYLENLATSYNISFSSVIPGDTNWDAPLYTSDEELVNLLEKAGHVFPDGYDVNVPIVNPEAYSILPPTEIIITNYMQGGVLW